MRIYKKGNNIVILLCKEEKIITSYFQINIDQVKQKRNQSITSIENLSNELFDEL